MAITQAALVTALLEDTIGLRMVAISYAPTATEVQVVISDGDEQITVQFTQDGVTTDEWDGYYYYSAVGAVVDDDDQPSWPNIAVEDVGIGKYKNKITVSSAATLQPLMDEVVAITDESPATWSVNQTAQTEWTALPDPV